MEGEQRESCSVLTDPLVWKLTWGGYAGIGWSQLVGAPRVQSCDHICVCTCSYSPVKITSFLQALSQNSYFDKGHCVLDLLIWSLTQLPGFLSDQTGENGCPGSTLVLHEREESRVHTGVGI